MALPDRGYLGLAKETTEGIAATPTVFLPIEEVDFPFENEFINYRTIRGSRQAYQLLPGAIRPTATFRGPLYASGMVGHLFQGLFGTSTSALEAPSTTARRHSFVDAYALNSYTLQRSDDRQGGSGILAAEQVSGAKVERIAIDCQFGEKVNYEVSMQVLTKPIITTPISSSTVNAAYPLEKPMYFKGATVKVDGTANNQFRSIRVEMNNTLTRLEALRGVQTSYSIQPGGFMCNMSGTLIFNSLTEYNKALNSTAMAVELNLVSDTAADGANTIPYSVKIAVPACYISKYSIPFKVGDTIEADVTFQVDYDLTTSKSVDVSIVNLAASGAFA